MVAVVAVRSKLANLLCLFFVLLLFLCVGASYSVIDHFEKYLKAEQGLRHFVVIFTFCSNVNIHERYSIRLL